MKFLFYLPKNNILIIIIHSYSKRTIQTKKMGNKCDIIWKKSQKEKFQKNMGNKVKTDHRWFTIKKKSKHNISTLTVIYIFLVFNKFYFKSPYSSLILLIWT